MKLEETSPGQEVVILNLLGNSNVMEKIKAMGLREGRKVEVLKKLGRNFLLKVGNSRIVISKDLAKNIEVQ